MGNPTLRILLAAWCLVIVIFSLLMPKQKPATLAYSTNDFAIEQNEQLKIKLARRKRQQVLACSRYEDINKVAASGVPSQLLALHRQIEKEAEKAKLDDKLTFDSVPSRNSLAFRHFAKANVSFCIPPRAGSTNWLRTLTPIMDFPERPSVYARHRTLSKFSIRTNEAIKRDKSVLNVRNPLTRLYSAWKDKFRYFQPSVESKHLMNEEKKSTERTLRGMFYKPYQKVFELIQKDANIVTFEDFGRMVIAIKEDRRHNDHWVAQNFVCDVCNFNYDFILHVEDNTQLVNYVMGQVGLAKLVLPDHDQFLSEKKQRIEKAQSGKEWEPIPNRLERGEYHNKALIQELYRRYFFDFIVLGYTVADVDRFLS